MSFMGIEKALRSEWPFPWLTVAIVFVILAVQKRSARNVARKKLLLPPGPRGLPIIGNLLQLGRNPNQDLYKLATKYGPLMTLKMGKQITVVATSPAMAEKVLKFHDDTLSGRARPHAAEAEGHSHRNISQLQMGPRWRFLKRMSVTNLFSANKLDSLQFLRRHEVQRTMVRIRQASELGNSVDIKQAMFVCTFNLMANTIFGEEMFVAESKELKEYQDIVQEVLSVLGLPNLSDHFPVLRWLDPQGLKIRADKAFGKLYKAMEEALQKRLEDVEGRIHNDLLGALLDSRGDEFSNWDIVGLLSEMFIAGTDTTAITVQWALAELMKNPSCMKRCIAEIDGAVGSKHRRITEEEARGLSYLNAVIKEVWRLHPPAPLLLPRRASEDTVLDKGYLIPKDARVLVNVWGIGRDPTVWKNPEKFEPERFLAEYPDVDYKGHHFELLPFGAGRRTCTGMLLATRMSFYVLASLLQSFEWSLPPSVHEIDMSERFGLVVENAVPLRLIAKPRLPAHLY